MIVLYGINLSTFTRKVRLALAEKGIEYRFEMAAMERVPAYVVFPDRSLIDMARLKPRTQDEMLLVHGVGHAKWDRYGAAFLNVVRLFTK